MGYDCTLLEFKKQGNIEKNYFWIHMGRLGRGDNQFEIEIYISLKSGNKMNNIIFEIDMKQ